MESLAIDVNFKETITIAQSEDISVARLAVKDRCKQLAFSTLAQTKAMTAASELARNTLEHGGGGVFTLESGKHNGRGLIRFQFQDNGPGIVDVELALQDGYSSRSGMGLGLGGAKRLMDSFDIRSTPGGGTLVVAEKWY
jgi:serine/threonine-protein kinase RsbT